MLVPDPTLAVNLLDHSRVQSLRTLLEERGVDFNRPRCGIISGPHSQLEAATARLRERGYQIIGITTSNTFSDITLFDQPFHPLDWAVLFQLMDVCITECMYGSIFCILNHTPFIALDMHDKGQVVETKTRSLMRRFKLSEFCLSKHDVTVDQVVERIEALEYGVIDWDFVDKELGRCQSEAAAFFQRVAASLDAHTAA